MYDEFIVKLANAGKDFIAQAKDASVALISHFDTDGLCAASILLQALQRENISANKTIVQNITASLLDTIAEDVVIFSDIGSAKLSLIEEKLVGKKVFVLDHHEPQGVVKKIVHLNPHTEDITEKNSISGAGVAYFFALGMNQENRALAYLGVLGAIGDTQERSGFEELNNRILQHAIIQKTIKVGERLRLFGLFSRPLVKVLEYSSDIAIPDVTGSEEGVKRFLDDLHIQYEWRGRLKKWYHLRLFEQVAITNKILELKKDTPKEELIVPTYTLLDRNFRRELVDMKEFATVINSCGRLEEYDVAINALQADAVAQERALMNLRVYKSAIHNALQVVDTFREEGKLLVTEKLVVINFKELLRPSLAGIVASILARNKIYKQGVVVCTLARMGEQTKISLRLNKDSSNLHLQRLLSGITKTFGADSGGHDHAAGAVIQTKDEDAFIASLQKALV